MKASFVIGPVLVVTMIGLTTLPASAYGLYRRMRTIKQDTVPVKLYTGQRAIATVTYTVTADIDFTESGNARTPDDRACHIDPKLVTFARDIVVTKDNGEKVTLGTTTKAMPLEPSKLYNSFGGDDCGKHTGDLDGVFERALGNAVSWRTVIENDEAETDNTLRLIGEINR